MSKRLWSGTLTAFVCTAGLVLSAQSYPSSPSSQNPSSSDKDKGQMVTVTGCVARATQSAIGTSGSATSTPGSSTSMSKSSSSASDKFILTNVTAGTSGTTDTSASPSASTASTYRLDADDSKLSPHVGHKVEITGRVVPPAGSVPAAEPGSANPSAPAASPSAAGASSDANSPKLKVESVKMISATCPE